MLIVLFSCLSFTLVVFQSQVIEEEMFFWNDIFNSCLFDSILLKLLDLLWAFIYNFSQFNVFYTVFKVPTFKYVSFYTCQNFCIFRNSFYLILLYGLVNMVSWRQFVVQNIRCDRKHDNCEYEQRSSGLWRWYATLCGNRLTWSSDMDERQGTVVREKRCIGRLVSIVDSF